MSHAMNDVRKQKSASNGVGSGELVSPFFIRFDDARHVGGYHDVEFPTENAARVGMENIKRKNCVTDAALYINGLCSFAYWGKTGRAMKRLSRANAAYQPCRGESPKR
jgi:hypothetical protein